MDWRTVGVGVGEIGRVGLLPPPPPPFYLILKVKYPPEIFGSFVEVVVEVVVVVVVMVRGTTLCTGEHGDHLD